MGEGYVVGVELQVDEGGAAERLAAAVVVVVVVVRVGGRADGGGVGRGQRRGEGWQLYGG